MSSISLNAFSGLAASLLAFGLAAQGAPSSFESVQTHALTISPDARQLFVVNTPDARLSIYDLREAEAPQLWREISTGLEPVAVAARTNDEVWVVCQLSDCVQVVDTATGVVRATIATSDEPMDVVFAGGKAFVSCSTEREVLVFDAVTRVPLGSIPVFCDEPGPLVTDRSGTTVYVASRMSGNDTTTVGHDFAPAQPAPTNPALPAAPETGLIVDSEDLAWAATHGIVLPDEDVFAIDVATQQVVEAIPAVGTVLLDVAVDPVDGSLVVANTEARNLIRFEPNLRGHAIDSRVSRIVRGGTTTVSHADLNPGTDYTQLPNPAALSTALSQPTGLAFSPTGDRLYVASFGTDRIGVLDRSLNVVARVEIGSTPGTTVDSRNKRGPRSLVHHPSAPYLYVHNRLRNSLSVIDTRTSMEVLELEAVHDPMEGADKEGRGFLYDAKLSGNGTMSCAACHVDARLDSVAWDLGDPGGSMLNAGGLPVHPMKGPMTTQTLQGLENSGLLHWRGDKATFQDFNGAFDSLMGGSQIASSDMDAYANFIDTVVFPSNPHRGLDDSLPLGSPTTSAARGQQLYSQITIGGTLSCVACHAFPAGTNGQVIPGVILQEPQSFEVAQLRNVYKRLGRAPVGGLSTSGFGLLHDGSISDLFDFLSEPVFFPLSVQTDNKRALEAFVKVFPTGTKPLVGWTSTLDVGNVDDILVYGEVLTAITRAGVGDGDLVVNGQLDGQLVRFLYDPAQQLFFPARTMAPPVDIAGLQDALRQDRGVLTFLGTVPGEGQRVGLDRDLDGSLDLDEVPESYGSGTTGCGIVLRTNSDAFVGNEQFAIVTEGAPSGAPGLVEISLRRDSLPFLDTTILVDLGASFPLDISSDASGSGILPVPIANDPALVGITWHSQAFYLGCGQLGVGASAGLTVTIGS